METLFIPAKSRFEVNKSEILRISKQLPKNLALVYSIQYEEQAKEIRRTLSAKHKIRYFQQILGCSKPKFFNIDAILLIGDGKFHAISLALETQLPVYIYNRSELEKISEEEITAFETRKKAAYVKFLHAKKVGVLISTKPGQQNLAKALKLKEKIKDKEIYFFLDNSINPAEFENSPEIQSWVNTACPRMDMEDSRIINFSEIKPSQC